MWSWPIEEQIAYNQRFMRAFRRNGGVIDRYYDPEKKIGGDYRGKIPLLILHHTGAKSGASRQTPLSYYDDHGNPVVVGSDNGSDKAPAWVHNLRADPRVRVELGREVRTATAKELSGSERDAVFAELVHVLPFQVGNQAKTARTLPLFRLILDPPADPAGRR
ncbi:hypothetical protein FG87_24730 [Nocardia vulneris]|nr:hypothetical protein FG87_24730 [Nocardia vulneris]